MFKYVKNLVASREQRTAGQVRTPLGALGPILVALTALPGAQDDRVIHRPSHTCATQNIFTFSVLNIFLSPHLLLSPDKSLPG